MRILLIILLSIVAPFTYGQLVTWNLGGPSPTTGRELSLAPTFVKEGITVSDLSKGSLVKSRQGNARGFSGHLAKDVRTFDEAFENNAYFEFSIGVNKGHALSVSALDAKLRVQEFSAKNFQWTYSLDGTDFKNLHETPIQVSNLSNSGSNQPSLDLSQIEDLQNIKARTKVTFRLYVWGNDNSQDKAKLSVGFGKSDAKNNSPVLKIEGSITKS